MESKLKNSFDILDYALFYSFEHLDKLSKKVSIPKEVYEAIRSAIHATRNMRVRTCYIRDSDGTDRMILALSIYESIKHTATQQQEINEEIARQCEISVVTARRWCTNFKRGYNPNSNDLNKVDAIRQMLASA